MVLEVVRIKISDIIKQFCNFQQGMFFRNYSLKLLIEV